MGAGFAGNQFSAALEKAWAGGERGSRSAISAGVNRPWRPPDLSRLRQKVQRRAQPEVAEGAMAGGVPVRHSHFFQRKIM